MKELRPAIKQIRASLGSTPSSIALTEYGDATRFREVVEANREKIKIDNVLGLIQPQLELDIPNISQIARRLPIFGQISETTNRVRALVQEGRDFVNQGQAIVGKLGGIVPEGYTKAALDALGEVNGVLDSAETVLDDIDPNAALDKLRGYDTQLIDWLLS